MTREEFTGWLSRLQNAFPAAGRLFENATEPHELVTLWLDVLHRVPLDVADSAIKALASGELEPPTFADDWAKFPARLRRWAAEHKPLRLTPPRYTPDQRTYRCLVCLDRGYGVEVFCPAWVAEHRTEIELGELADDWQRSARRWCRERGYRMTGSVDCSCEAGKRLAERRKHRSARYNASRHCLVPGGGEGMWRDALQQWVAAHPLEVTNAWQPVMSYDDVVGGYE